MITPSGGGAATVSNQTASAAGMVDPIAGLKTATTDSSGAPGSATANTPRGRAGFPADSLTTAIVITNSLVNAASGVFIQFIGTGGANLRTFQCSKAAGSFTVTINAPITTGTLPFDWFVVN